MEYGGEAARPTAMESTDLGAVQGGEPNMSTGTSHGQLLSAAAARHACVQPRAARQVRSVPVAVFHREPGAGVAVAYANIRRQPGPPLGVVLVGQLQLPRGAMPVHDNYYGYSALQHRPGAGLGVVLGDLLPGGVGAVYSGDYALQPRPGAGDEEVLVDLLSDGAGHGQVFVGLLPDGVGVVFDGSGNFGRQALLTPSTRAPNLSEGYDDPGIAVDHLRRLLAFAGIGAASVVVNGLAAGPGSPVVAFHLFVLLLGGLFLVILHMLRV